MKGAPHRLLERCITMVCRFQPGPEREHIERTADATLGRICAGVVRVPPAFCHVFCGAPGRQFILYYALSEYSLSDLDRNLVVRVQFFDHHALKEVCWPVSDRL